jgi:hypothetical protein
MIHSASGSGGGARLAALMLALVLAACSTTRQAAPSAPSAPPPSVAAGWQGREGVQAAIAELNEGNAAAARARLMTVLNAQPGDTVARQLIEQIDDDPRRMLGAENYRYTLREGETLSMVAQRALGNPLLFYALARYNNIAVPNSVQAGQTILVPGRRPTQPARRATPPRQAPAQAAPQEPQPAPVPAQPARDPARSARLRGQGLAALNAGEIDRAVSLLRQAVAADPENAAARGDLARALRIQSTVRARH